MRKRLEILTFACSSAGWKRPSGTMTILGFSIQATRCSRRSPKTSFRIQTSRTSRWVRLLRGVSQGVQLPEPVLDYIKEVYNARHRAARRSWPIIATQISQEEAIVLTEMTKAFVKIEGSSSRFDFAAKGKADVHRQASRRMAVAHRGLGAVPEPAGAGPALPPGDGRPRPRARQGVAAGL